MRYVNTIVVGFDDVKDPDREKLVRLLTTGVLRGWCTYLEDGDSVTRTEQDGEIE